MTFLHYNETHTRSTPLNLCVRTDRRQAGQIETPTRKKQILEQTPFAIAGMPLELYYQRWYHYSPRQGLLQARRYFKTVICSMPAEILGRRTVEGGSWRLMAFGDMTSIMGINVWQGDSLIFSTKPVACGHEASGQGGQERLRRLSLLS